jgi:nucleoside 2-deoxyribosyltransferase
MGGRMIYLIGSLRNPEIPKVAAKLRSAGLEVFDDWYSAGEFADDSWRDYEKARGHDFKTALKGYAAKNVYNFDLRHLERADAVVLVLPAGRSGHLELGYSIGRGKPGYILLDSPDRWDVMYQFADLVTDNLDEVVMDLCQEFTIDTTKTHQLELFTSEDPRDGVIPTQSETASYAE